MNIKMLVEAYCPTIDDVNELEARFNENYWSFFDEFENEEYNYDEKTKMVHFVWGGVAVDDFADCEDDFIRSTHHAEDLYEDSNIEHIHVEVCVDGKWYGKQETHEKIVEHSSLNILDEILVSAEMRSEKTIVNNEEKEKDYSLE